MAIDEVSQPTVPRVAGLYTRKSTGLVRSISLPAAIYFNVTTIGVIFAVLVITATPAGFPNSNPVLMAIITTLVCLPPALLYGMWTATVPRSGADYVWNGRTFHPWIGFSANFLAVAWFVLSNGFLAYLIGADALPTAFVIIGRAFNSPTITGWAATVSEPNWTFALGIITLAIVGIICSLGMRRALRFVAAFFFVTVGGALLATVVLFVHTQADFQAAVQQYGGNYNAIIAAAAKAGYSTGHYDFGTTLLSMPPLYLALGYAIATAYSGGELRQSQRVGLLGPVLAVIVAGAVVILAFVAANNTLGFNFIGAATTLSNAGSADYPLAHGSNFFFFASMLSPPVVQVLLALAYLCAPIATLIATSLWSTRAVFAWSFDRILPDRLASVSPRTGAPIPALMFVIGLAFIYLVGIRFYGTTTLGVLGSIVIGSSFAFMLAAVGAIILPYWRKSMFENSPFRQRFLGVPVFSIVGAVALVVYVFMWWTSLTQSAIGANTQQGLIAQGIVAVIAILIYPISYALNRMRGVDLSLLTKELPPE